MCTLVVAAGVYPDAPLLVAANRDERLDRPADPPRLHPARRPVCLAPLDRQAGGTWLGLNAHGVFVGLTNRLGVQPPRPELRSRGELVFEALAEPDPRRAAERVAAIDPATVNRFHLVAADRQQVFLVVHDGLQVQIRSLGPGLHLVTERSSGAGTVERERWLRARLPLPGCAAPTDEVLRGWLAFHHPDDPFAGTCVHWEAGGYGTRSSMILRLFALRAGHLVWTEGPPCRGESQDLSGLLESLLGRAGEVSGTGRGPA